MRRSTAITQRASFAFTLMEVLIASALLGIMSVALFSAFSYGLSVVQSGRENLRATQILLQKMETIRLFRWTQTTNTALATTNFTELYDPTGTNTHTSGAIYQGTFSIVPAPTNLPGAYRNDMQLATVTVYWTNYLGSSRKIMVRTKQMQTYIARYGLQNYVY